MATKKDLYAEIEAYKKRQSAGGTGKKSQEDWVKLLSLLGKNLRDPLLGANELGSAGTYSVKVYDDAGNVIRTRSQQIGRRTPTPKIESDLRAALQGKLTTASDMGKLRDIYGRLEDTQFEPDILARGLELEKDKAQRISMLEKMMEASIKATGSISDPILKGLEKEGINLSDLVTEEDIPSLLTAGGAPGLVPGLEALAKYKGASRSDQIPIIEKAPFPTKSGKSLIERYFDWYNKVTSQYYKQRQTNPRIANLKKVFDTTNKDLVAKGIPPITWEDFLADMEKAGIDNNISMR